MAPQTPEIEATRLRGDTWGEGRYPVDPVRIAHELGIDVRQSFLSPNVSGALIKEVGQDPVILLNANDSRNRQRFTCAHELGHFFGNPGHTTVKGNLMSYDRGPGPPVLDATQGRRVQQHVRRFLRSGELVSGRAAEGEAE